MKTLLIMLGTCIVIGCVAFAADDQLKGIAAVISVILILVFVVAAAASRSADTQIPVVSRSGDPFERWPTIFGRPDPNLPKRAISLEER